MPSQVRCCDLCPPFYQRAKNRILNHVCIDIEIGATVRQLVPVIFERISGEDAEERQLREEPSPQFAQLVASILPKDTDPFVVDAYLMFQDIVVSIVCA